MLLDSKCQLNNKIIDVLNKRTDSIYEKNKFEFIGTPNKMDPRSIYNTPVYKYSQQKLIEWLIQLFPMEEKSCL